MSDKPLIDAVVASLKAAPAVTAVAGQRIHASPPRLPTYPCVVVTRAEGRPVGENDAIEHLLTLTCASRFGGPEVLAALSGHILAQASLTGTYTLNPALAG